MQTGNLRYTCRPGRWPGSPVNDRAYNFGFWQRRHPGLLAWARGEASDLLTRLGGRARGMEND